MARYNVDLQDNEGNAYQIMANPDSVAEFSPAVNRENIRSGETYRVIFGKIMKYLSEVGNAAYVGLANNCTTTIAGFALDARQGKELMDRINELNRDLGGMQFGTDGDGNCGYYGADGSLIPFNRMTDYTFYVAAQGYGGGLTFPRSFLDAAGFTKADIHSSKGMHAFNTATTHKNRILYSVHDEIGVDISSNGKFTEGFSVFQLGDGGTGGSWGTVRLYK